MPAYRVSIAAQFAYSLLLCFIHVTRPVPPVHPKQPLLYRFLRGKTGVAGILTFTHVATSKVSLCFSLRFRAYKAATRGLTFFTSLGFGWHRYSGARDEIYLLFQGCHHSECQSCYHSRCVDTKSYLSAKSHYLSRSRVYPVRRSWKPEGSDQLTSCSTDN